MEDREIWFEFEKLERWQEMSDELRLSTLIHYMKEYNVDESYDHYVLLTLAAHGFLGIEYNRQVVDDSVLRYMDNETLSSLWDDAYIFKEWNNCISVVHTVPDDHPLHPFVEYIQSHYANNYTHSHDFYASKFEADFELSYLMLLIGEEKLRENYRKIFLDTYQPKSDGALWKVPNENLIDLDDSYLSHLHDGVFPEPTTIKRWYGEWESFVVNFLDIKQGCVFDLHAGVGTLAMHLNLDNVVYRANAQQSKERDLMSMLFYTDIAFEEYYARNQIQLNKDLISSWEEGKLADYVIANMCNIRTEDANDYRKRLYVFGDIIDQMSSEGKALVACNNQQLKDASSCISLVDSIILLAHGKSIVLLNKNKEFIGKIKVYDRTGWSDFTVEQLLESIHKQENLHILTKEDINDMGGYFDITAFRRQQYKIEIPAGEKLMKLSEILTLQNGYRLRGDIKNVRYLHSDIEEYTPLSPYVTAENGEYISESDIKKREYRLIDQKRLVVLAFGQKIRTFIFDPRDGEAGFHSSCLSFVVDEEKVYIDYLVYQMNEEYFLKQLFPSGGFYIHAKAKDILSCQILVPDGELSIERQKQFIEGLRQKEISAFARRYGYDLGEFVQYKDSDLPEGTKLKNGKYTILKNISRGGFGKVYKALNEETQKVVAVKEFFHYKCQVRDPQTNEVKTTFDADIDLVNIAKEKFRREKAKIQECAHANIVKVYEEFEENNTCYYSMEYIEGKSLVNKKCIGEREALTIIRQVAEALKAIHEKGYNHSDVKPQNILLDSNGVVTLIDFGGAHYYGYDDGDASDSPYTVLIQTKTEGYTPELAYKKKGFHAGRDIFSLGATLYYLLTGSSPKAIDKQVKPDTISPKSWRTICSAVEEDPGKWLNNMDEFLALLPNEDEEVINDIDVLEPKKCRITPRPIVELKKDEVFVFGSNVVGRHSGGAAKQALKWGAKWHVASGLMGQTYGIPTVGIHGLDAIEIYVSQFIKYVEENDHITFYVTAIGCGSAGFTPEQIAPLFKDCVDMPNVYLPESFWQVLRRKGLTE